MPFENELETGFVTIGNFTSIFSFYHGTSVSLGDAVIIFGGYDNGDSEHARLNLKQIGKVITEESEVDIDYIIYSLIDSHLFYLTCSKQCLKMDVGLI